LDYAIFLLRAALSLAASGEYMIVLDHGFFRFAQWAADPPLSHKINL